MKSVNLIECMNYTWQAEGPDAGKKMLLLRFKRCNRAHGYLVNNGLTPCKFCDTIVKMNIDVESLYSFTDIQQMINANNLAVLITGGEPGYGLNLSSTIDLVNHIKSYLFNIETNGCNLIELIEKINKNKNVRYMLSPKIFEDSDYDYYFNLTEIIKDNENVNIKLVYEGSDYNIKFLEYLKSIGFNTNRIWLMPEGKTRDDLIKNSPIVFDAAEKYKTNFTSREHIIYGFV